VKTPPDAPTTPEDINATIAPITNNSDATNQIVLDTCFAILKCSRG
jgi:hypothetical protein